MPIYYLQKSYLQILLILATHLAAVIIIFLLGINWGIKCLLLAMTVAAAMSSLGDAGKIFAKSITLLSKYHDQSWIIHSKQTGFIVVRMLPQSIITRYFLLLQLQPITPGNYKKLVLFIGAGSLPVAELRQIRALIFYE